MLLLDTFYIISVIIQIFLLTYFVHQYLNMIEQHYYTSFHRLKINYNVPNYIPETYSKRHAS